MIDLHSKYNQGAIIQQIPKESRHLFVSYYWSDVTQAKQGFGNILLGVAVELYANNMPKLIMDLTKQIKLIVDERMNIDSSVEILFFR